MKESIIKRKSYSFAVRIIELHKYLISSKQEYIISKQLLKSGTSIGANVREAVHAESEKDFVHKLSIAQKEANETLYWLELLIETGYLSQNKFQSLYSEGEEIKKIITSIIVTMKAKAQ
jgi:four helix bundle protein